MLIVGGMASKPYQTNLAAKKNASVLTMRFAKKLYLQLESNYW